MAQEFDGKKYEKASTHQKEWRTKLIDELNLHGDEHILDLGCGDGRLTVQLSELVPDGIVVGIDASQGMIETARNKERKNLHFRKLDINDLQFDGEFDVVFSNATLHWVKDHKRLLQNVRKVLRVGGRLRFNFAGDGNCSHLYSVIREAMNRNEYSTYFTTFDWPWYMPQVAEYTALVQASGLNDFQVWGENTDRHFPDEESIIRWIDQPSIVPFLVNVSEKDKESFRELVVRRMIEETKQKDGRCFETFRRINLSAFK